MSDLGPYLRHPARPERFSCDAPPRLPFPCSPPLAVAGCGSSSSSKPAASASSDTYKSVTVSGAFDKAPTVNIPKVKGTGDLYTKTVIQGTGATLTSAEGMVGNYVAYDWSGKTSKLLGSSYTRGPRRCSSGSCSRPGEAR